MKFYMTEDKCRVANIPYDNYIKPSSPPKSALVADNLTKDGGEENSRIINSLIEKLPKGGTLVIPEGKYKISTVKLKSDMTFFVSYGAELISLSCDENEKAEISLEKGVITGENCENLVITGGGKINGMGLTYTNDPERNEPFYALEKFNTYQRVIMSRKSIHFAKDTARNHVLYFKNCKNLRLENIILTDSAFWTVRFDNCFDVKIQSFIIDSHMHIANSDGLDICGGENYEINHCFIACADDAVCIKTPEYPLKNVKVSDCILTSCANCFKIGTETQFDVSDIKVESCHFFMADNLTYGYSGIAIESCDGAKVKNVFVSDITMQGVSSVLLVWLGRRFRYDKKEVGEVENISFKNIHAENIEMPCAVVGCVKGLKKHRVKNVYFENVIAVYRDTDENLNIRKRVGEYTMKGYPDIPRVSHIYHKSHEQSKYWDLPCYGICLKHTENVSPDNITVTPRKCNTRPFAYFKDVK